MNSIEISWNGSQLPADLTAIVGVSIGLLPAACVLLCKTMTFRRVVEKLHKWQRNSFVFGVELDAIGERFTAIDGDANDFGDVNVGVA